MKKDKLLKNKILVIIGPTSSGKTKLAVKLAKKFDGEIVSADSRQVYRGMDVGTGKDLNEYILNKKIYQKTAESLNRPSELSFRPPSRNPGENRKNFELETQIYQAHTSNPWILNQVQDDEIVVPYHLIDVVSPKQNFNLAEYVKLANESIKDILERGKLPIVVGGTGLYLQALVDGYDLSEVKPDKNLREQLEKLSKEELFGKLKVLDKKFAEKLNNSERNNKRRLIRYLEVRENTKIQKYKNTLQLGGKAKTQNYNFLIIGLRIEREELKRRIYKRLINRLEKEGLIKEVDRLRKEGISWRKLESFGMEYKYVALYLQNKLSYEEMVEKLNIAIRQFAKRQMSWFKRWEKFLNNTQDKQQKKIFWVEKEKEAEKLIKNV